MQFRLANADSLFIHGDPGSGLVPIQVPFAPDVRISNEQDDEKHQHFDEREPAEVLVHRCPGKQEDNFDVENEENESYDIEADIEADAGITEGNLATLIGGKFAGVRAIRSQEPGHCHPYGNEQHPHDQKDQNSPKFG
jgi:hypothetical protein